MVNSQGYVRFKIVAPASDKTGHEFLTWRRSFLELAPMLFK